MGCGGTDTSDTTATPAGAEGAGQVKDNLSGVIDCEWTNNTQDNGTVHLEVCDTEQLMLATGDPDAVTASVDSTRDHGEGFAVVADEYALATPDHGKANALWDALDADG